MDYPTYTLFGRPATLHHADALAEPIASPAEDVREVTAFAKTDYFVDPRGAPNPMRMPMLLADLGAAPGRITARVDADLGSTYAAGGLIAYGDDARWAKFCLERDPGGAIILVSVVTDGGVSDDVVHVEVPPGESIRLRLSRLTVTAFAFHYALPETPRWTFARYFGLGRHGLPMRLGIHAQCPHGERQRVRFGDLAYVGGALPDLRSGE